MNPWEPNFWVYSFSLWLLILVSQCCIFIGSSNPILDQWNPKYRKVKNVHKTFAKFFSHRKQRLDLRLLIRVSAKTYDLLSFPQKSWFANHIRFCLIIDRLSFKDKTKMKLKQNNFQSIRGQTSSLHTTDYSDCNQI